MGRKGGERVPWLYRFVRDRTGQSTAIGMILVLGITVIGTGLIVVIGANAIDETERTNNLANAEHSMTRLDSRVAMVGLGETSSQRVDLGPSGSGQYRADPDDGWIRIVHQNFSAAGGDEVLYNGSLGAIRYVNDDTTIAYQGGGVWRKTGNGTSMVSPPEFHYRGATLTLPIMRVVSEDAASGDITAAIDRGANFRQVYPDASTNYTGSSKLYRNPVVNGTVVVTVHSEYYKGWAHYFRTRTQGNVSVDHAAETTTVELVSVGRVGAFSLADALDANGLEVRSQSPGHSITDFEVDYKEDQGTIDNTYFSFHTEDGPHRLEMVIHVQGGTKCNGGLDSTDNLSVYYFYRNVDTGVQHEWYNESVPADSAPFWVECDGNTATIHANYTSNVTLTYDNVSINDEGTFYDWDGDVNATANFDHSGEDGEPKSFSTSGTEETWNLTRHYFALMGEDFQLRASMGTGDRTGPQINVGASSGVFDYQAGAGAYFITYLHITENEVEVEFR